MDVHCTWNSNPLEFLRNLFFPLIDRAFYLVFDLTVHKLYLIYVIFVQLKESILCNLNLFEFFQYYLTVQDII